MSQIGLLFFSAILNLVVAILVHLIVRWIDNH